MVLYKVLLLLFWFFILALDKYMKKIIIQLISSRLILTLHAKKKSKIRYKKALARGLFYYKDYFTGYF